MIVIITKGIFIKMFYVETEVSKKTLKLSCALFASEFQIEIIRLDLLDLFPFIFVAEELGRL